MSSKRDRISETNERKTGSASNGSFGAFAGCQVMASCHEYLQAILAGQVDLEAAVAWLVSDLDTDAPGLDAVRQARSPSRVPNAWTARPLSAFRPAQLRAYVLDHIRDQAAPLLEAGAAPIGRN